jgi:uncharacterized delta-60 repeat protein
MSLASWLSLRTWFRPPTAALRPGRGVPRRLRLEALEERTLLSAGDLDPTFGNGGLVASVLGFAHNVAVQPDGRLLVVGGAGNFDTSGFAVARYNPDGSLDGSFGHAGLVITTFPGYTGASATSVAVQADGSIVVAGSASISGDKMTRHVFAVARYADNGSPDESFGNGGLVATDFDGTDAVGYSMAVQADGGIILAGTAGRPAHYQFALARYASDGSLDGSFGTGGKVTTSFPGFQGAGAFSVAVQPDGRIVAAGSAASRFALARYASDGTLDDSFGTGGLVTLSFGGTFVDAAESVAVQADGSIVTAGYTSTTPTRFALARFGSDGRLDSSFGTGGQVTTAFPGFTGAEGLGMAVQNDGRILVAGGTSNGGGYERFALARYDSDGSLDGSFGTAGLVTTSFPGFANAQASGVAVQADGRIVVAGDAGGFGSYHFAVARYEGDAGLATRFDVSAPATVIAGQPFDVTVTALDDNGEVVPDYVGTVTLTSTDPLAPALGSHTFTTADGGTFTFSAVQLFTAGPQSLVADDGNLNGQADLTVDPGVAVGLLLSGPDHATAGVPFVVTVSAVDAWGNVATGYAGTAWLEASDPAANLPDAWEFTADDAGVHQFTVTLHTPGPVRLTAHDTDAGWSANLDLTVV